MTNLPNIFSRSFFVFALLLMALMPAQAESPNASADEVLFRFNGLEYGIQKLPLDVQQELYEARLEAYKKQKGILNNALMQIELERLATQSGKSVEALSKELFAVKQPDEKTLKQFYNAAKAQIPYPFEQVKDQLARIISEQSLAENQLAWLAKLKEEKWFELGFSEPKAPFVTIAIDGFPSKGAADAPITIVEFADYQCPHCQKAATALKNIQQQFGKQVRVVYMDFPINRSGISRKIAFGAVCADQQGRFWEYHDQAFATQAKLNNHSSTELAKKLGLDAKAFAACLASDIPEQRVKQAEAEATRLGIKSTPSIYLNGRLQHLHDIEAELPAKIQKVLDAKKS